MADPIVHLTNGIPDSGTGNITTLGQLQTALLAVWPAALGVGGGLKIDGSGTAVPISGTLTANAGTNLNTSALALESGGNLAALNTVLGTVTATPVANTIADRLKTINTTLSGTLTIGSPAVTNAGTFAVQAAQSGVWNVTNISGTISLPTGAATSAKQPAIGSAGISSPDVLSVQGIASGTALPISATSLPLPAGAASAANQTNASAKSQIVDGSGNVIGATSNALDVNIKSGSGGTSSTFGATMPLVGTATGLFDGTNMVRAKGDETNGLWVNIKAGAGSGGTSATDEGAFTAGTSAFTPVGGFFQTTATSNPLTTGQYGYLQLTANRAAHVNLRNASGVAIGVAGAALVVDGSAVTQPVSGTFWQATQPVSAASLPLPSGAATSAKQPALGTAGTPSADVLTIQGSAASGASASGNPLPVSGLGVSSETVVTAGQAAALITDLARKLIVLPYANPENMVSGAITSAMTGTTSTSLIAAPAAGLRNYITSIVVSNSHATVGTDVIIQDGSGGTTLMTIPAAAVYGGAVINLPVPLRQPSTATAIFCANVTTGASTKVSAVGYKGA